MENEKPTPDINEIEDAVVRHFDPFRNLIVPNIADGLGIHECDVLILTPAGYAYEVEIKTSRADLIRDKQKPHGHRHKKIKALYFAIPETLIKDIEHIPERAGIFIIKPIKHWHDDSYYFLAELIKKPEITGRYKFTDDERYRMARLGTIRMWDLKRTLRARVTDLEELRSRK